MASAPADTGTRGRSRLPRHLSRQRIVAAAALMLRHTSLADASIGTLAGTLSMTGANIYRHFSSKRALADAVCALHAEQAIERLRRCVDRDLPADRLVEALVLENLRYNLENFRDAPHTAALLRTAASEQWPGFRDMATGLHAILAGLIETGIRQGVFRPDLPPDTAHTVLMALKSVLHPVLLDELPPDEHEAEARRMIAFILRALGRDPGP